MAADRDLSRETIKELMTRNPEVIQLFKSLNLACLGCAVQPFCTAADAALLHDLDVDQFVSRLETIIASQKMKSKQDG